jgi:Leucine-rich repeat (LRR) protein
MGFLYQVLEPVQCVRACVPFRLEELHVANNDLTSLPPSLGLLSPRLRALSVRGNALRTIRRPILEAGTERLLQYLRDRLPPS